MAFNNSETNEIEKIVRKEIRNFLENPTIKQFEDKLMDKIGKEIKKGSLEKDIKELVVKMFSEFYHFMWTNRNYWENKLKNV